MLTAGHEIMHLHFHNTHWSEIEEKIGKEKTFDLKEALTVLLNIEFKDLWFYMDSGYSLHKELRDFISKIWKEKKDFDPYAGRKLYSYLYDLNYQEINVDLSAHHLIYGKLAETDEFNWMTKTMVAARNSGYDFYRDFAAGYDGFYEAFRCFFADPRRFTYTPVIACSGRRGLV